MTFPSLLLLATLGAPLALVALCLVPTVRRSVLDLLPYAPLPGLVTAIIAPGGALVLAPNPFRFVLALDPVGAMLLGGAALLWTAAGFYARASMPKERGRCGFAVWWLLTLAGSFGVFIVADMTSFYLMFSLVSLSAYGLVVHEGTPGAERAGRFYMALAVLGEAFLLFGFVLLATAGPTGNPMIADAVAALPASPWRDATYLLLILGFGLKMGLVPLHVWMPLAHPVAPTPASAALSGIVVKAGVIGLIRFLPFDQPAADWGTVLIVAGVVTAYFGVVVGVTQRNPKTILAYSTVSQMGVVATLIGAGVAQGDATVPSLAAFYALHHILVKGALFMGVGVAGATGEGRRGLILAVMAVLALSLAGLPLTSGALAKFAAKGPLGSGAVGLLVTLSAAGSALLMLHFLRILSGSPRPAPGEVAAPALRAPWLATAAASILVAWALFPSATGYIASAPLAPAALWASIWPILVGGLLASILALTGDRVPRIPEGDLAVVAERAGPAVGRLASGIERLDGVLRQWSAAGIALLLIAFTLATVLGLNR